MDKFERIAAYVSGQMDKTQRRDFEDEMSRDDDLRREVEAYAKMEYSLDSLLENDVRKYIGDLSDSKTEKGKANRNAKRFRLTGLLLLILLFAIMVYVQFFRAVSPQNAFDKYYKAPMAEAVRGEGGIEEDQVTLDYLKVHELIKSGDEVEAFELLNSIAVGENHKWHDNIEWYRALLLLKLDPEKGKSALLKLQLKSDHKYANEIDALIADMRIK